MYERAVSLFKNGKVTDFHDDNKIFIKHKAVSDKRSVSEIINEYFADMLEDFEDIKVIEKRRKEPSVSFDEMLNDLGLSYDDLRS